MLLLARHFREGENPVSWFFKSLESLDTDLRGDDELGSES
jgi:hypothetical protein